MNNRELAQWCIDNNNMNNRQAEECVLINPQKLNALKNLQWDFNELCIAYFLETAPLFWNVLV